MSQRRIVFLSSLGFAIALSATGCASPGGAQPPDPAEHLLVEGVTVVSGSLYAVDHMRVAGDTLLFAGQKPTARGGRIGQIWAQPIAGGERKLLAELTQPIRDMAVVAGALYAAVGRNTNTGVVVRIDLATGVSTRAYESGLVLPASPDVSAFAADGHVLYMGHDSGDIVALDTIVEPSLAAPAPPARARMIARDYAPSSTRVRRIAVGSRTLYLLNSEAREGAPAALVLYAAPLDGTARPREVARFTDTWGLDTAPMVIEGDTAYLGAGSKIYKASGAPNGRATMIRDGVVAHAIAMTPAGLVYSQIAKVSLLPRVAFNPPSVDPVPILDFHDFAFEVVSMAPSGDGIYLATSGSYTTDPTTSEEIEAGEILHLVTPPIPPP